MVDNRSVTGGVGVVTYGHDNRKKPVFRSARIYWHLISLRKVNEVMAPSSGLTLRTIRTVVCVGVGKNVGNVKWAPSEVIPLNA